MRWGDHCGGSRTELSASVCCDSSFILQFVEYMGVVNFPAMVLIILLVASGLGYPDDDCPPNAMTYFSSYSLARQTDLNKTFGAMKSLVKVGEITYSPRVGRTYIIENMTLDFYVISSKETAKFVNENHLKIEGSVLKLNYKFAWQKKQLSSSVKGTAQGQVLSDPIMFTKVIILDREGKPDQILGDYTNITFTSGFPVSNVSPYSQADNEVLFEMMNSLKDHITGKQTITKAINSVYSTELNKTIESDSSQISIKSTISYSYFDYRGEFKVVYDNPTKGLTLSDKGIIIQNLQTIKDDPNFECGTGVPDEPKSPDIFGGVQTFYSNSLLKSTVRYILGKKYFNVVLNQQNWQSRAFQFYVGDLYLAIPALKKYPADTQVSGSCEALNDNSFNFSKRFGSNFYTQYQVALNFTCSLKIPDGKIIDLSILTTTIVNVTLDEKHLGFHIDSISGKAKFNDIAGYKIDNLEFANFLVSETLKTAKGAPVFGNGYPTSTRQFPKVEITDDWLFLYDSSAVPHLASS